MAPSIFTCVYGESVKENEINLILKNGHIQAWGRTGQGKNSYEHLSVLTSNNGVNTERTKNNVCKGRKALAAAMGVAM